MARENQGLQITLIVFIMLTLVLGVTTFLFYKQADEAVKKEKAAVDRASAAESAARTVADENDTLRNMIGFASTDDLQAIEGAFTADKAKYAEQFASSEADYRKLLADAYNSNVMVRRNLNSEQSAHVATQNALKQAQADKVAQNEIHLAAANAANDRAQQHKNTYDQDVAKFNSEKSALQTKLANTQQKAVDDVRAVVQEKDAAETERDTVVAANDALSGRLDEMTRPAFEKPDGLISWILQGDTVWINLGAADGLQRGVTFSVYPQNTNDVTQEYTAKGTIEVTEVLGDHRAQARILTDEMANPIMPKDLIHTPLWAPGQKLRFAFTNGMDIDGDNRSDIDMVLALVNTNNAIADAYVVDIDEMEGPDGELKLGDVVGQMSVNTRYLVAGPLSTIETDARVRDARTQIETEAKRLGVRTISLPDFLRMMGYKESAPVVTYGEYANPEDFRAKPPTGSQKASSGRVSGLYQEGRRTPASSGRVSDLFRKRTPPQHATGTAYE